jgi:hypothetical protein
MTKNYVAKRLCQEEGLKVQLTIAQAMEVISVLQRLAKKEPEIIETIFREPKKNGKRKGK